MTNPKKSSVRPGEIRLELINKEWPLTPLGASKDPYIRSWQNNPYSIHEIENEILKGQCKAIGLLSGPVYNLPYGLVWVDVDGPIVYNLIEDLAGEGADKVLPKTLTILSGKVG